LRDLGYQREKVVLVRVNRERSVECIQGPAGIPGALTGEPQLLEQRGVVRADPDGFFQVEGGQVVMPERRVAAGEPSQDVDVAGLLPVDGLVLDEGRRRLRLLLEKHGEFHAGLQVRGVASEVLVVGRTDPVRGIVEEGVAQAAEGDAVRAERGG
jgi:hypothetical protein